MHQRDTVKWFANYMEHVLLDNDHKGGWRNIPLEELFSRLANETGELQTEINFPEQDMAAIIKECADIANFAMMVADVARKKAEETKK